MKPGKISENVLKRSVLKYMDFEKTGIVRGAGVGNDCALFSSCRGASAATCSLRVKGREKVRHAIFAAVNNLWASGQEPRYLLLTITLPERAREIKLREIMEEAEQICREYHLQIIGGHTETSELVTDMIVSVTALSDKNLRGDGAFGDGFPKEVTGYDIVVAGYIGMEAAGLVALQREEELLTRYPKWLVDDLQAYREHVSVGDSAKIAIEHGEKGMHDVGEGGIFASLWELAQRTSSGLQIDIKKIPMRQSVIEVCNFYDLNPYEVLSQGCLLIVAKDGDTLVQSLTDADIPAAVIGKLTEGNDRLIQNGEEIRYMDLPKPDQIRKLL